MEATASDPDPFRPARDDHEAVVERILDQLPARADAALGGDREALIGLLLIAADVAWQSRAEVLGTRQEVAADAHRFADEVVDCYSNGQTPSDRMCDFGFALADRVDALSVEVLHLRAGAGRADDTAIQQPRRCPAGRLVIWPGRTWPVRTMPTRPAGHSRTRMSRPPSTCIGRSWRRPANAPAGRPEPR